MNTRRWAVLAVALTLSGCGGAPPDPAADRLTPGQIAIVAKGAKSSAWLHFKSEDIQPFGASLNIGTEVQCDSDKKKASMASADAGERDPNEAVEVDHRQVRVIVMDGEHKGRIGTIRRCDIKPVAKP